MSRFKGKTNFAIFKEDGTPWTQEEYDIVTTAFEDPEPFLIIPEEAALKYLYYNDFANNNEKYHIWQRQEEPSFTLTGFTVLGYNDFLKQLNPPIQRRRPL